jgi:hypothetical protein
MLNKPAVNEGTAFKNIHERQAAEWPVKQLLAGMIVRQSMRFHDFEAL